MNKEGLACWCVNPSFDFNLVLKEFLKSNTNR